jgi:hypothetical protein
MHFDSHGSVVCNTARAPALEVLVGQPMEVIRRLGILESSDRLSQHRTAPCGLRAPEASCFRFIV